MKLTLKNLVPSIEDQKNLHSLDSGQRKALYNLCEILSWISYEEGMREQAKKLQKLIKEKTYTKENECDFDKTLADKATEEAKKWFASIKSIYGNT